MKTFYKITLTMILASFFTMIAVYPVSSEPPFRAKERIEQLKKIKLLDILQLSEERSTKFLSKYNEMDRQTEEKKLEMEHEMKILEVKIKSNAPEEEIKAQTEKALKAYKAYHESLKNKMDEMKSMLTDIEFAKFLVFESQFHEEVRKIIMKNYRNRHKRDNRGPR